MKIRRILATAVVAAVTTPAVLLSVTPALADAKPAAQTQKKPSVAELEKAAEAAKKAYDDAVAAEGVAYAAVEEAVTDTTPLAVAHAAARKAADDADAAKTVADEAVTAAEAAVEALPETATEEERTAAATALAEAQAAAATAAEAKTTADAEAKAAKKALDDYRVAAFTELNAATEATKKALEDKTAADAALAKAKEEEEEAGGGEGDDTCVPEADLTTVVTGLPSKVVAGTTVDFKLRVTNGTTTTMDRVFPFVYVHATDKTGHKDIENLLRLQWSSGSSSQWNTVDNENYIRAISPLKAGAHADIKLRLSVDAAAPAGEGVTFVAGDYWNDNGACGGSPKLTGYEFEIAPAGSKPGKVDDAKPGTTKPNTSGLTAQSGTLATGSLAATGTDATSQLALASGAAVALGAGAMFVVRRRRTGADA
ncbi:LPXTG cell wall anchor domain-containing protein [Streptomyces sp. NRRL WC-3549]|uniref:LPXTG cell wall anchor domain-containing protein n=1 Tax=Streptomyces sp. NRRL WC-3549 TaxID=1463925 RepID=UPI0004CA138C|nr:LPXTG cell wall anchor domain-containing protein [Streptomyces sp. NRRL WC-3549]